MTLGSTPFDFFLACGTFSCRSLLLKVDLHQIWDQNWGLWKTQLVMTCENNSEPVKQRGIKHLWKGIRLLPLLTSYVPLGKEAQRRWKNADSGSGQTQQLSAEPCFARRGQLGAHLTYRQIMQSPRVSASAARTTHKL
jgi:hypothetical protein